MDPFMIRGTSSTIIQRRTQPVSQQSHSNSMSLRSSSRALASKEEKDMIGTLSTQKQSLKLSSKNSLTLSELRLVLEAWKEPETFADIIEAKERIVDCFKQRLDSLNLSFLYLSTLPDVFDGMQHVHYLSIDNNYFSEIPWFLTKLTSLKRLNISSNVLSEVPDFIKEFKQLEFFNVESNQLKKVSEELGRLPKLRTLMLTHNRIMKFPQNLHRIKNLELEDQIPLARFGDFSPEFEVRWKENFQYEATSGYFEIWMARYEEMLRMATAEKYRQMFKERISTLLSAMVNNANFRKLCFDKAINVIQTSHDGILFSLFELEVQLVEQRIMELQLSDEEVRQEVERAFNFYRLQELAILRAQIGSYENNATAEEEVVDAQETVLFYYISPENTLEMPLNCETPGFMYQPDTALADHHDVRKAVEEIRREKEECGPNYLIDFVLDKEYWINYLSRRYASFIMEHTQVFVDEMEETEEKKDTLNEYDYLTKVNALVADKNQSEQKLYYQLTTNILTNS
ncbi:unnamed protein product [Rotaria magnacalcarata]|uniref:NEL domain-containing protein n=4 Tax=Rotaria magnacalcarata TaxID=392030 RepID=A0A816D6C9_9BILA|nr:unnamed protein product [Rotaria magnacalcarata]